LRSVRLRKKGKAGKRGRKPKELLVFPSSRLPIYFLRETQDRLFGRVYTEPIDCHSEPIDCHSELVSESRQSLARLVSESRSSQDRLRECAQDKSFVTQEYDGYVYGKMRKLQ
jgi:hypothetical protein